MIDLIVYAILILLLNIIIVWCANRRPNKQDIYNLFDLSCDEDKKCVRKRLKKLKESQEEATRSGQPYLNRNSEVKTVLDEHLDSLRKSKTRTGLEEHEHK